MKTYNFNLNIPALLAVVVVATTTSDAAIRIFAKR